MASDAKPTISPDELTTFDRCPKPFTHANSEQEIDSRAESFNERWGERVPGEDE